jgi:hypothetical protein
MLRAKLFCENSKGLLQDLRISAREFLGGCGGLLNFKNRPCVLLFFVLKDDLVRGFQRAAELLDLRESDKFII